MADSSSDEMEAGQELIRSVAHDLRHSLFALRTGIQLLAQVRANDTQFNELSNLLEKEVETATERLKELLRLAAE